MAMVLISAKGRGHAEAQANRWQIRLFMRRFLGAGFYSGVVHRRERRGTASTFTFHKTGDRTGHVSKTYSSQADLHQMFFFPGKEREGRFFFDKGVAAVDRRSHKTGKTSHFPAAAPSPVAAGSFLSGRHLRD